MLTIASFVLMHYRTPKFVGAKVVRLLKSVQNPSETDFKKPNLIYVDMVRCADARE